MCFHSSPLVGAKESITDGDGPLASLGTQTYSCKQKDQNSILMLDIYI